GRPHPGPAEEAAPDALEEVERVEPRPQQPRQLPPHHQAHLGLVPGQQLARGVLVAGLDAGQERSDLAVPLCGRISATHGLASASSHPRPATPRQNPCNSVPVTRRILQAYANRSGRTSLGRPTDAGGAPWHGTTGWITLGARYLGLPAIRSIEGR